MSSTRQRRRSEIFVCARRSLEVLITVLFVSMYSIGRLAETESEYATVMQQVDLLKREDEERKSGRTKEGASDVTSNSTAALRKWSKRANADKSTMLTPRFLQTKGVDSKLAAAVQTWQSVYAHTHILSYMHTHIHTYIHTKDFIYMRP